MNRRSFMGLLGIAPVALKSAPVSAGHIMQSVSVKIPAGVYPDGISIRYIRDYKPIINDILISRIDVISTWPMMPAQEIA